MPIPILKLPHVIFQCVIHQLNHFDLIHLCTHYKSFVTTLAKWRIAVETFEFQITNDTCMASWNGLELKIWLRTYLNPYGPGVRLSNNEKFINLKVSGNLKKTPLQKMENVLDNIFQVLKIQNFDFNFCTGLSISPREIFIWSKVKKFRNFSITSSPGFSEKLSPEDFHFFLQEIQVDNLTLDVLGVDQKYEYTKPIRARKVVLKDARWLYSDILNWTSSEVTIEYPEFNLYQVQDFLRAWLRSENVTLKRFSVPIICYKIKVPEERLYIDAREILEERATLVEKVLRRQRDEMKARATVTRGSFKFELLEE